MNGNLRSEIVLSVNRALLGEVFPELVGVSCHVVAERQFELTFFVESEPQEQLVEDVSCIETEVIADFPNDFGITHEILVSRNPKLEQSDFWIFRRK